MDEQALFVGLVCSDADLVEYYVQLITEASKFTLKAIWCPDTERSIQVAADTDVPSVSHTAYQLISRNDINAVVIAGHSVHNALFSAQTQVLKKKAISIGPVALSEHTARLSAECSLRNASTLVTIYPLKYTVPFSLIQANIAAIGTLLSISVESTFRAFTSAKHRLYHDSDATLHEETHGIVDALSSLCGSAPKPIAATCLETTSIVEHFRLRETRSAHLQVGFGTAVASIRIISSNSASLLLRVTGSQGFLQFDGHLLMLEGREGRGVLWRSNESLEVLMRNATLTALQSIGSVSSQSELDLVRCVSNCTYL